MPTAVNFIYVFIQPAPIRSNHYVTCLLFAMLLRKSKKILRKSKYIPAMKTTYLHYEN